MDFALTNLVCLAAFFAAFCCWGFLACPWESWAAFRPAVGVACCALFATVGFEAGLPVAAVGRLMLATGLAGALLRLRLRGTKIAPPAAASSALFAAAVLLLALPAAVGGAQFALFQANINDQFNYLASAVVRTTSSSSQIASAGRGDFLVNPLLAIAHTMSGARPAVVDLYASFEGVLRGNLHRCSYGFLCSLLLATFLAVSGLVHSVAQGPFWRAQLVGLAYVAGFWGQLQLDLNAWSWAAASPVAVIALALASGAAAPAPEAEARGAGVAAGLCVAGLAYLYPEMLFFMAPAAALAVGCRMAGLGAPVSARVRLWAVSAAVLLLAVKAAPIARFAYHQFAFTRTADYSPLDWVWQAMVGGPAQGAPGALRWAAGSAGLGWLLGEGALRWPAVVLGLLAVAGALRFAWQGRRGPAPILSLSAAVAAAQVAACVGLGHPWAGAKGLSYASLLVMPLVLLPAAAGGPGLWRLPAWLLLCLQVAFGVARPIAAGDRDGIHYRLAAYPAVMDPALKTRRSWDVGEGPALLRGSRLVKIDVPDAWLEAYGAICAQAQGLRYFKRLPVYTYLGISEENYGTQSPSGDFDALIYLDYDRNQPRSGMGFARRDGAVWTSGRGPRIVRIAADEGLDTVNGLLAWHEGLEKGPAITRITIAQREPVDGAFEIGILAPPDARSAAVSIQYEGRTLAKAAVSGLGSQTIQGLRVPLHVEAGRSEIDLVLVRASKSPPDGVSLQFVNPRLDALRQEARP